MGRSALDGRFPAPLGPHVPLRPWALRQPTFPFCLLADHLLHPETGSRGLPEGPPAPPSPRLPHAWLTALLPSFGLWQGTGRPHLGVWLGLLAGHVLGGRDSVSVSLPDPGHRPAGRSWADLESIDLLITKL